MCLWEHLYVYGGGIGNNEAGRKLREMCCDIRWVDMWGLEFEYESQSKSMCEEREKRNMCVCVCVWGKR